MAAVAEATAVTGAVAAGAFRYNRENYMFDQGLRWGRFTTGYSMAMAQAAMYREDVRDLTTLTVTKQDTYHTVGVIFFVLNFQLIMAGRLGVHGPSPPGWLLGLYWTNICSALMFLVTFTWMAMHAAARATAGGAFMLTRHVRLPIPTPSMLDKARKTGNSYEKQRVADIFRVPFACPAPQESELDPEVGWRVPLSDRKMPKWYHDETDELRKDEGGSKPREGSNPVHFELYRGLQEEWWGHDVYSRIGILYFMSHWLTSASLYSMCHVFTELRCIWPAYTVTACFVAAHRGILALDILQKPRDSGKVMGMPVEKVVPFVPFLCVLGMTIDYSVLDPTPVWQGIIYFLSWVCYIVQFAWALRLYNLAAPVAQTQERDEAPGQPWWPQAWPLPPAFEEAVYMVAAPKQTEQPCIQQEMKAAKGKKGYEVPATRARGAPPPTLAWKLFRGACVTTISMWVLIMIGRVFEQVNGERWLLKQENRMERWPSHYQPWMSPWTRKGSRNEWCHAGGCDRRLTGEYQDLPQRLANIADALAAGSAAQRWEATTTPSPPRPRTGQKVAWPAGFRPVLLAEAGGDLVAFAAERRGALLRELGVASVATVTQFAMEGIEELGEVTGAVWGRGGLMVTMTTGAVAECGGLPEAGVWSCRRVGAPSLRLPGGLAASVAARIAATDRLQAAVIFEDEDAIVLLEADEDTGEWLPAGEVHLPQANRAAAATPRISMTSSGEDLILSFEDGLVLKRSLLAGGHSATEVALPRAALGKRWHSSCGFGGGHFAHLATPNGLGAAPELFVSSASA